MVAVDKNLISWAWTTVSLTDFDFRTKKKKKMIRKMKKSGPKKKTRKWKKVTWKMVVKVSSFCSFNSLNDDISVRS